MMFKPIFKQTNNSHNNVTLHYSPRQPHCNGFNLNKTNDKIKVIMSTYTMFTKLNVLNVFVDNVS